MNVLWVILGIIGLLFAGIAVVTTVENMRHRRLMRREQLQRDEDDRRGLPVGMRWRWPEHRAGACRGPETDPNEMILD